MTLYSSATSHCHPPIHRTVWSGRIYSGTATARSTPPFSFHLSSIFYLMTTGCYTGTTTPELHHRPRADFTPSLLSPSLPQPRPTDTQASRNQQKSLVPRSYVRRRNLNQPPTRGYDQHAANPPRNLNRSRTKVHKARWGQRRTGKWELETYVHGGHVDRPAGPRTPSNRHRHTPGSVPAGGRETSMISLSERFPSYLIREK